MNNNFNSRLKSLRQARKLTMQKLANQIGVSSSMISYYEKGKKTPSLKTIENIANALHVSVDYLLGKTDTFDGSPNIDQEIKKLIEKYEKLDPSQRDAILKILNSIIEK